MGMFGRLFRRQPKTLPPLEATIYMRGNRWFAHNPIKWCDMGYSVRTANELYKLAKVIATQRNLDIIQPRKPGVPAAPIPQDEDSDSFTSFLVAEEVATIANDVFENTPSLPADDTQSGFDGGGGDGGGGGSSGDY